MDQSAAEQCTPDGHFIYDSSAKQFVNVGPCADVHEVEPESDQDAAKAQVLQAAMKAQQAAQGQKQTGFGMDSTVLQPSLQNLKNGMGLGE